MNPYKTDLTKAELIDALTNLIDENIRKSRCETYDEWQEAVEKLLTSECSRKTPVVPAETSQRMERRVRRLIAAIEMELAENLKLKQGATQFDLEMFVTRQAYRLQEALEKTWAD